MIHHYDYVMLICLSRNIFIIINVENRKLLKIITEAVIYVFLDSWMNRKQLFETEIFCNIINGPYCQFWSI